MYMQLKLKDKKKFISSFKMVYFIFQPAITLFCLLVQESLHYYNREKNSFQVKNLLEHEGVKSHIAQVRLSFWQNFLSLSKLSVLPLSVLVKLRHKN